MKPVPFLILTVLMFSLTVFAQKETGVVIVDLSSPYEIAKLVNENRRQQKLSRVNAVLDLRPIWQRLRLDSGSFDECGGDCTAEISTLDLNSKPGPEVILKLTGFSERCRFLVFRKVGRAWTVVGHVDHNFNRYQMARHRVVRFSGKPWLLIRGQEGSGSGFSLYSETWYQVSQSGIRSVLSYPVAGTTYPWPAGLAREFKAQTITDSKSSGDLVLRYIVSYIKLDYNSNKPSNFMINEHRVRFKWNKKTKSFKFNPARSDVSEAEISAIANIEDEKSSAGKTLGSMKFYSGTENKAWVGGGYEVFLKYNLGSLMKVASDKNNKDREWLRLFLNDCHDIPEKRALTAALERGR
jgi:hypothetical protein